MKPFLSIWIRIILCQSITCWIFYAVGQVSIIVLRGNQSSDIDIRIIMADKRRNTRHCKHILLLLSSRIDWLTRIWPETGVWTDVLRCFFQAITFYRLRDRLMLNVAQTLCTVFACLIQGHISISFECNTRRFTTHTLLFLEFGIFWQNK